MLLYVLGRIINNFIINIVNIIIIITIILIKIIKIFVIINIFLLWKNLRSFVYIIIYCVGALLITLMCIFDGLGSYFFSQRMEKMQPMSEE